MRGGLPSAIARGIAYAPYADLIWCETSKPDLAEAKEFAEGVLREFPNKMLSYNCSPSFNWKKNLDDATIAKFQRELGAMGYKLQFITLAGFHSLNYGMFDLAREYKQSGMTAYCKVQEAEFASEKDGYEAVKHQRSSAPATSTQCSRQSQAAKRQQRRSKARRRRRNSTWPWPFRSRAKSSAHE